MFEDLVYEKANAQNHENNSSERPLVTERREFYSTHFVKDKLRILFDNLQNINQKQYIGNLMTSNDFSLINK